MALPAIFRGAVDQIRAAFDSALENVGHRAWTGETKWGTPSYAAAVSYRAFIQFSPQDHPTPSGQVQRVSAYVLVAEEIAPNGTSGRVEPIDMRDLFTLPDGSEYPIVEVAAIRDAETTKPYFAEIWLGDKVTLRT